MNNGLDPHYWPSKNNEVCHGWARNGSADSRPVPEIVASNSFETLQREVSGLLAAKVGGAPPPPT